MSGEHVTQVPHPADASVAPTRTGQILVVGIILAASVAALVLSSLTNDTSLSPAQRQARTDIRSLEGYFKAFHRITGRFPSEAENFVPLLQSGVMREVPMDPWGRSYVYRMEGTKGYVISYGADGRPGGKAEDADVLSVGVLEARLQEDGP